MAEFVDYQEVEADAGIADKRLSRLGI